MKPENNTLVKGTEHIGDVIRDKRMQKGISVEKLAEGLYDSSMLMLIESGKRTPDRLMTDRLLDRLGISVDDYELFLDYDEYDRWLLRQRIVDAVLKEELPRAETMISQYEQNNDMDNKLAKQFCLVMKAQCMSLNKQSHSELAVTYEEALKLTAPDIDSRSLGELVLSAAELNLVIEYAYYSGRRDFEKTGDELLEYIERAGYDIHNKSKIYPKLVCYMFQYFRTHNKADNRNAWNEYLKYLRLCNEAVDILRNASRTYYIIELLDARLELISLLTEASECPYHNKAELDMWLREAVEWRKMYLELYRRAGLQPYMRNSMQFYIEGEVYCISDVVRIRRKMLGLSVAELAEGICSERTIRRIENRSSKTHREIVSELFYKMGIPYQLHRTDLITSNYEAKRLKEELDGYINWRDNQKALECIKQIEKLVDMNIPLNRQTMLCAFLNVERSENKISKEKYAAGLKEALEYTVPYKSVVGSEELYLTNGEMNCLHNISITRKNEKDNELIYLLYGQMNKIEQKVPLHSFIMVYEFIMYTSASYFGNIGEYDQSDILASHVLEACLLYRRTEILHRCIYNNQWNSKMRETREKYNCTEKEEIDKSILLCRFCKDSVHEAMYAERKDA